MTKLNILFVFLSLGVLHNLALNSQDLTDSESDPETDVPVFEPTEEWKEIKPGQSIPPGLHVRVDLQTGKKEAKLMGKEEDESNGGAVQLGEQSISGDSVDEANDTPNHTPRYGHSDRRGIINKATKVFTRKELSEMLKNLRDESPSGDIPLLSVAKGSEGTHSSNSPGSSTTRSTTIDELKQMVTFHSDVELMLEHLQVLIDPDTPAESMVTSLHELEYYVHQIDNARDLDLLGGLSVIVKLLNHTNSEVQSAAAFTLGAAVQGNPEVQEKALAYEALSNLLHLLDPLSSPDLLQRRALYALGSLLRGHPKAVEAFMSKGGIDWISTDISKRSHVVIVKIMTLLTDLLGFEDLEERMSIAKSEISMLVTANGWCTHVLMFLESNDLKALETTVNLISELKDECNFIDVLPRLEDLQERLSEDNVSDVIEPLRNIIHTLKLTSRDEL